MLLFKNNLINIPKQVPQIILRFSPVTMITLEKMVELIERPIFAITQVEVNLERNEHLVLELMPDNNWAIRRYYTFASEKPKLSAGSGSYLPHTATLKEALQDYYKALAYLTR